MKVKDLLVKVKDLLVKILGDAWHYGLVEI